MLIASEQKIEYVIQIMIIVLSFKYASHLSSLHDILFCIFRYLTFLLLCQEQNFKNESERIEEAKFWWEITYVSIL